MKCKVKMYGLLTKCEVKIYGLLTKCKVKIYGLLTKCEVKMAGYWSSFFFVNKLGQNGFRGIFLRDTGDNPERAR